MSRLVPVLAATLVVLSACSNRLVAPTSWQWGIPVYPHAAETGRNTSTASFVLYHTADSLGDVYAWYLAELPKNTPHAYDANKREATFALFDARARRTVHIEDERSSTAILITKM